MSTALLTEEHIPLNHWEHRGQHYHSGEALLTRRWAEDLLPAFGPLRFPVRGEFLKRRAKNSAAANEWLRNAHAYILKGNQLWRHLYGPTEIDEKSKWLALVGAKLKTIEELEAFRAKHDLPVFKGSTPEGVLKRAENWHRWRRVLRTITRQFRDQLMRLLGFVSHHRQVYCSDHTVETQKIRDLATRELLAKISMKSDEGDEFTLQELHEFSVANPKNRFAEMMVRCKGVEQYAIDNGQIPMAVTITTPSAYHACHYRSGDINEQFNGTTPRQANNYLVSLFAKVRTFLGNKGIVITGYRVAEPHHDGTPHWHAMLFFDPSVEDIVRSTIELYALLESPNEPGAREHRVKFESIDPSRGSATGYMTKYIAKNIAGAATQPDLLGLDAPEAAQRVIAWAKTWGIRQFQFFGGPSITIWREYRRIRDQQKVPKDSPHYAAWKAASIDSDFAAFMTLMGSGRDQHSKLARKEHLDTSTGECTPPINQYGEPLTQPPIIGIERDGDILETRTKKWTKVRTSEETTVSYSECTALPVTTKLDQVRSLLGAPRRLPAASVAQALLRATLTKAGEPNVGFPAGTVFAYPEAFSLPPSLPGKPATARWDIPDAYVAQRRAENDATGGTWTCVNNCTDIASVCIEARGQITYKSTHSPP